VPRGEPADAVDGGSTVLRVDPATGELAGYEDRDPFAPGPSLPQGTVTLDVTITYGWTDQRPS
jgi:hypothetical protein